MGAHRVERHGSTAGPVPSRGLRPRPTLEWPMVLQTATSIQSSSVSKSRRARRLAYRAASMDDLVRIPPERRNRDKCRSSTPPSIHRCRWSVGCASPRSSSALLRASGPRCGRSWGLRGSRPLRPRRHRQLAPLRPQPLPRLPPSLAGGRSTTVCSPASARAAACCSTALAAPRRCRWPAGAP